MVDASPALSPHREHLLRVSAASRVNTPARVVAAFIAMSLLAMLAIGASLNPDPHGHGTHTQLGLPRCGWEAALGMPCATCGMTTAVTHMAHGHPVRAFLTQPLGALIALAAAAGFWAALHVAATGSQVGTLIGRWIRPRTLIALGVIAMAAWGYTIATWPQQGG